MRFGKIKHFMLLGGGPLLMAMALKLKKDKSAVDVITSPRHAAELIWFGGKALSLENILKENTVPYRISSDINTDQNFLNHISSSTLGISFGAAWIFKPSLIGKFAGRLINCHGTCLPGDRGGGGFSWRILRGDRKGCHLFHLVDEGIDTGHIIFARKFVFPKACRIPQDYQNFFEKQAVGFFSAFLRKVKSDAAFSPVRQNEEKSSYFPRLSTQQHAFIDWSWPVQDIERFVCAFSRPYQGASSFWNGKRIFFHAVKTHLGKMSFHPFMKGLVYRKTSQLYIAAIGGALTVKEIYDEEGRDILSKIKVGDRFVTPSANLEQALSFRAVYDAQGLRSENKSDNKPLLLADLQRS